jgi:hypothetical protein
MRGAGGEKRIGAWRKENRKEKWAKKMARKSFE